MSTNRPVRHLATAVSTLVAGMCLVACDYEFDKNVKFCEKIPVVGKVCTPSIDFEGKLILESVQTVEGIPVSGTVKLDMDEPFNTTITKTLGLGEDDGKVCYNASEVKGVDLKLCMNAIDVEFDYDNRVVSGRVRVQAVGKAKIEGYGISKTVTIFTTPTVFVPFDA